MEQNKSEGGGWRERKRHETFQRIAEAGLDLFATHGYEATTLDAIAEASGIAKRTFFYYFKSKEEILLAWQNGLPEAFRAAVLEQSTDQSPLEALRKAHLTVIALRTNDQTIVIDRIIRSSEQLRASNQAKYLRVEQAAFEALCALWPQPERREALRMVVMVSVGALRLALDAWADEGGSRPLADYYEEGFANLKNEVANA